MHYLDEARAICGFWKLSFDLAHSTHNASLGGGDINLVEGKGRSLLILS